MKFVTLILVLLVCHEFALGLGGDSYSFVLPSPGAVDQCVTGNTKSLNKLKNTVLGLTDQVFRLNTSTCAALYGGLPLKSTPAKDIHHSRECSCNCRPDVTLNFKYRDCQDVKKLSPSHCQNGPYDVYPVLEVGHLLIAETKQGKNTSYHAYWVVETLQAVRVYCQLSPTMGHGWTVIQRRTEMDVSFDRSWNDYKNGFGDLSGDFWLGLDKIYKLTNQKTLKYMLRITLWVNGVPHNRDYASVVIGNEASQYKISVGSASGSLGGGNMDYFKGKGFSTKDKDNSGTGRICASYSRVTGGGFWFGRYSSYYCGTFNPNAARAVYAWSTYPTATELKIRPINP